MKSILVNIIMSLSMVLMIGCNCGDSGDAGPAFEAQNPAPLDATNQQLVATLTAKLNQYKSGNGKCVQIGVQAITFFMAQKQKQQHGQQQSQFDPSQFKNQDCTQLMQNIIAISSHIDRDGKPIINEPWFKKYLLNQFAGAMNPMQQGAYAIGQQYGMNQTQIDSLVQENQGRLSQLFSQTANEAGAGQLGGWTQQAFAGLATGNPLLAGL